MAASNVLSEQYVDIIARGLQETLESLRALQRQGDEAGRGMSRLKREIEDIGTKGFRGEQIKTAFDGATSGAAKVAASLGIASASITAIAAAGLQGTVQAERMQRAYTEFTRHVASALLPAIDMIARGLETVNHWIRTAGLTGQQVFYAMAVAIVAASVAAGVFLAVMTAVAAVVTVATGGINVLIAFAAAFTGAQLAAVAAVITGMAGGLAAVVSQFSAVQTAFGSLLAALGELWTASQPLIKAFADLGVLLVKVVVVDGLVLMVNAMTTLVVLAERLVSTLSRIPAVASLMTALGVAAGNMTGGEARAVRLNQTGTEDAQGTFQRIQQAVLAAGLPEEERKEDPALAKLEMIRLQIESFERVVAEYISAVRGGISRADGVIEGAKTGAGAGGIGSGVLAGLFPWMR